MVREYWCASDFVVGYGYRYSGGTTSEPVEVEESEESVIVIPDGGGSCSGQGCPVDSTCVGIGTRLVDDDTPVYCDLDGSLMDQKEDGETCQNNFECLSNTCGNGECQNYDDRIGALEKEMEETRNVISRILSWLKGWFGGDDDEDDGDAVEVQEVEDCGTAQLGNLGNIFGPTPTAVNFSNNVAMLCFEKHLEDCSPARVATISHDNQTQGWLEIKGDDGDLCSVEVFSQRGQDDPVHAECPFDIDQLQQDRQGYDVYADDGGLAFLFTLKAAFTLAAPPAECTVFS
jgi:hypothetical protein